MKLSTLLEDNSGGLSSTRFQMLIWTIGVLAVWIFVCVKMVLSPIEPKYLTDPANPNVVYVQKNTVELPAIPETVLILLLGVSGLKAVQLFGEKSDVGDAPETPKS
jgi:hypothetical protein